jgi:hypothetical protein
MKKHKLSKRLKRQLRQLFLYQPPDVMSHDLRNIFFDYIRKCHGTDIVFERQLLNIQALCNWLDYAAQETKDWNMVSEWGINC